LTLNLKSVLTLTTLLFVGYIVLTCIYEIFYILNDAVFVYREDSPTFRTYINNVSVPKTIIARLLYSMVFTYLWCTYFSLSLLNVFVAVAILTLAAMFHNLQSIKLKRVYTFATFRLARWLFIPICILGPSRLLILLVVLLPYFAIQLIWIHSYELNKYGIQIPKVKIRYAYVYAYVYAVFLPLQVVLLYPNILPLIGNIAIIIVSFAKSILEKRKRNTGVVST